MSRLKRPPFDAAWKFVEELPARMSLSLLDYGSKVRAEDRVDGLLHSKSIEAQSNPVAMVWKFGKEDASSGDRGLEVRH
ncbi:hypothetical protein TNCV_4260961 [Trichonephila clavipes]|nr:hypothetical protein TNCV_4260961 [Trichonephila clavipes]